MKNLLKRACIPALFLLLGIPCRAVTLISLGPADPPPSVSAGYPLNNVWAASWTLASGYQNVAISAWLGTASGFTNPTLEAYVTTQIGVGSLPSSGIASLQSPFSLTNAAWTEVLLFSNLTLPAGTYYLVLHDPGWTTAWGGCSGTCAAATAPGVTLNADQAAFAGPLYRPASDFGSAGQSLSYRVTGDPLADTPEPSTALLAAPVLAFWLLRRRQA